MVVYIEYAVIENFFVDISLLFLAAKTVKANFGGGQLFLSALGGTLFAVLFPLLRLPDEAALLIKLLVGVAMCVIAIKKGRIAQYLTMSVAFYLYTFTFGGALFALYSFFSIECSPNGVFPVTQAPMGIVFSFLLAFVVFGSYGIERWVKSLRKGSADRLCRLSLGKCVVEENALYDSGNSLTFQGHPVSIVSVGVAAKLCSDFSAKTPVYEVEVSTVNGNGKIKVFQVDEIRIYSENGIHKIEGGYVGVSRYLLGGKYSVILNRALL